MSKIKKLSLFFLLLSIIIAVHSIQMVKCGTGTMVLEDEQGDVYIAATIMGGFIDCTGPLDGYDHMDVKNVSWFQDDVEGTINITVYYWDNLVDGEMIDDQLLYLFFDLNGTNPEGDIPCGYFSYYTQQDPSIYTLWVFVAPDQGQVRYCAQLNNGTSLTITGTYDENYIKFFVPINQLDDVVGMLSFDQWRVFGFSYGCRVAENNEDQENEEWDFINWPEFKAQWYDKECDAIDDDDDDDDDDHDVPGYSSIILITVSAFSIGMLLKKKTNLTIK